MSLNYNERWAFKLTDNYGTSQGEVIGDADGSVTINFDNGSLVTLSPETAEMLGLFLWKGAQQAKNKNG